MSRKTDPEQQIGRPPPRVALPMIEAAGQEEALREAQRAEEERAALVTKLGPKADRLDDPEEILRLGATDLRRTAAENHGGARYLEALANILERQSRPQGGATVTEDAKSSPASSEDGFAIVADGGTR